MADKTSFTKEEWTLLLQSPMIAGMAVTAADPSGLWGLLKESFAGGALTQATTDSGANSLVKAVAADFATSEGRSAARDGLKSKLTGSQAAEIKTQSVESLKEVSKLLAAKAPGMPQPSKTGCAKLASALQRPPQKEAVCSVLAAFR